MSVYPKRITAGDHVFIHVRVQSRLPGRPLMRVILEAPTGVDTLVGEFWPAIFPRAPKEPGPSMEGELIRVEPVYLTARHLVGSNGDLDSMLSATSKIASSNHFHFAHRMPATCAPGRYRVRLEMRMNGVVQGSDTATDAFFFVDGLRLLDAKLNSRGGRATIENLSGHQVPARVVGIGAKTMWSSRVLLQPGPNELRFKGQSGYLSYCEGRHTLALDRSQTPFCVRNEGLPWHSVRESDDVLVFSAGGDGTGRLLSGRASTIWRAASGLVRRDEIRTAANHEVYDEMMEEGLLLEIPGGTEDGCEGGFGHGAAAARNRNDPSAGE